jgi:tetratricopeptide (TPR) repeat protein
MSSSPDEHSAPLPIELGRVLRPRKGSAPFCCDLIAAGPGHPRESERVIFDVLQSRHAAQPYDWVFMTYDASQKQGEFAIDEKELAIEPYRNFPDSKITADIAESYVRDGFVASAWAFGLVAQPAFHVLPLDDWYGWAVSRDTLRQLDATAGRLAMAAALLERTSRTVQDAANSADPVRQLLDLVRLRWTGSQWLASRDNIMAMDVAGALAAQGVPGAASMARLLSELRHLAASFYDASLRRTEAVVAGAVERMRQTGARRGAILIAIPWLEQAEAVLVTADVGFDVILPAKVAMSAMLDDARLLLGVGEEQYRRLGELFSGKRIRTRIEALLEDRPDLTKARAQDWAGAAQGLACRYEIRHDAKDLKLAEECVSRALALDEAMDHAWWVKGELLTMQRKHEEALVTLERALALAPRNAPYWRAKGAVLDHLGRTRAARTHFVRAIHLSPRDGSLWTFLGLHYHRHGRRAAACYCFGKGKEYRNEAARDNHRMLRCPEPRLWNCPFILLPIVIRAMNRVVLPLRYGW